MAKNTRPMAYRLRLGRYSAPGCIYLITTTTHQRQPLFADLATGRIVIKALQQAEHSATTLCFVVMPDHLHWLMQLHDGAELSATVQRVKSVTSRLLHRQQRSNAPVWQRGFHDRALRRDEDIKAAARYIVANPIRAGLVKSVGEYSLWDAAWV